MVAFLGFLIYLLNQLSPYLLGSQIGPRDYQKNKKFGRSLRTSKLC